MASKDLIKCEVSVERVRFYKDEWGIAEVTLDKATKGTPITSRFGSFIIKGNMPPLQQGMPYYLTAQEVEDPKYGKQYEVICISSKINIDTSDKKGQKMFLETLFTDKQVQAMYDSLPDPFGSFSKGSLADLIKIKGCSFNLAPKWLDKFNQSLPLSKIYLELEDYNLTNNMINRLLSEYRSADLVIEKIKNNPYLLTEINGIGWKTADEIALAGGMELYSQPRIETFIEHYLENQAQNGHSYIEPAELMGAIIESIGEGVPDFAICESVHAMGEKLWYDKEKTKIGLKKYRNLEENIGKNLIRILKGGNSFNYDNWEDDIIRKEYQQGWNYTNQQKGGIKSVLDNQIIIVTGKAGTGKSSIVAGMLAVLKNYSFAQCALAGKAAARLAEVTQQEGFTIHRLLDYNPMYANIGGFGYYKDCQLPYDIIIVDEISMIDARLFYSLLQAIKTGTKLILLGDVGQLESIGCGNIAYDMIHSGVIPVVTLTEIHRQALTSAIVTESGKIYDGEHIISKDYAGVDIRGEAEDLVLDCYSDKGNTFYKIMQHFSNEIKLVRSIMDLMIIVPVKTSGDACTWNVNNAIQELYNPSATENEEITVFYSKGRVGALRVGDKVINTQNNYKTRAYERNYAASADELAQYDGNYKPTGKQTPIFNGNMGIITQVNKFEEYIIVDFTDIGEVVIPKKHMRAIELGYAITVHKSQGSEAERVIIGIDYSSYIMLSKELVYTAVTRAKKHCTLVAQNSALRYAISQHSVNNKCTHLKEVLYDLMHPKFVF